MDNSFLPNNTIQHIKTEFNAHFKKFEPLFKINQSVIKHFQKKDEHQIDLSIPFERRGNYTIPPSIFNKINSYLTQIVVNREFHCFHYINTRNLPNDVSQLNTNIVELKLDYENNTNEIILEEKFLYSNLNLIFMQGFDTNFNSRYNIKKIPLNDKILLLSNENNRKLLLQYDLIPIYGGLSKFEGNLQYQIKLVIRLYLISKTYIPLIIFN